MERRYNMQINWSVVIIINPFNLIAYILPSDFITGRIAGSVIANTAVYHICLPFEPFIDLFCNFEKEMKLCK